MERRQRGAGEGIGKFILYLVTAITAHLSGERPECWGGEEADKMLHTDDTHDRSVTIN